MEGHRDACNNALDLKKQLSDDLQVLVSKYVDLAEAKNVSYIPMFHVLILIDHALRKNNRDFISILDDVGNSLIQIVEVAVDLNKLQPKYSFFW